MSDYIVNALRVEVGVNMGDHAQDVTTAVDVRPDDTIGSVIERHLMGVQWKSLAEGSVSTPLTSARIEIRVALDRDDAPVEGEPF